MFTKTRRNQKKGFTLVELIVVIAIVAILAAVAIPMSIQYINKAKVTRAQDAVNECMKALQIEANAQSAEDGATLADLRSFLEVKYGAAPNKDIEKVTLTYTAAVEGTSPAKLDIKVLSKVKNKGDDISANTTIPDINLKGEDGGFVEGDNVITFTEDGKVEAATTTP